MRRSKFVIQTYGCRDGTRETVPPGIPFTVPYAKGKGKVLRPPCRTCGNPSPIWYCPVCTALSLRGNRWPALYPPGCNPDAAQPCKACGNPSRSAGNGCPVCAVVNAKGNPDPKAVAAHTAPVWLAWDAAMIATMQRLSNSNEKQP